MLECQVCGAKFNATVAKHYIACDTSFPIEGTLYDAFNCPMCGCQVIAKERKCNYILKEDSKDDEQSRSSR